jgi:hypothetical protein
VLDHGGDDLGPVAAPQRLQQRRVVGLGGAGGEDDFAVVLGADQRLHLAAGLATAAAAALPKSWPEDGLPKLWVKNGSIAWTTSGSVRVVAALSR